jgi:hypothetical protein
MAPAHYSGVSTTKNEPRTVELNCSYPSISGQLCSDCAAIGTPGRENVIPIPTTDNQRGMTGFHP